jgi:hypothetical protein
MKGTAEGIRWAEFMLSLEPLRQSVTAKEIKDTVDVLKKQKK